VDGGHYRLLDSSTIAQMAITRYTKATDPNAMLSYTYPVGIWAGLRQGRDRGQTATQRQNRCGSRSVSFGLAKSHHCPARYRVESELEFFPISA
jgi:hypothetical protein